MEWFFLSDRRGKVTKVRYNFISVNPKYRRAPAHQHYSFHFQKISKNIKIFFVKIGMKLPFTLKKKCKHFLKFKSLKLFFYPQKSMYSIWPWNVFFVFWLRFSFKYNRHTNVLFVCIFENSLQKVINYQKRHFGRFLSFMTVFIKKY